MHPTRTAAGEVPFAGTVFRDGSIPAPETRIRRGMIHGVALFAIAVTAAYLAWRLMGTIALDWWWVAIPLFGS